MAIALNYSIKNIRNDVRQIIIIIFDEKSRFNSLVWGSLTLAQLISEICIALLSKCGLLVKTTSKVHLEEACSGMSTSLVDIYTN